MNILIIDDSPADRTLYKRLLSRSALPDCHVDEADSAALGVQACQQSLPDCILLDYHLPDSDGHDVLRRLADDNGEPRVPVVMLTGRGSETIAARSIKLGAQDYLIKGDIDSHSLGRAVEGARNKFRLQAALREQREEFREFAHSAAHDLKAPLRKIEAYSKILRDTAASALDGESLSLLQAIERCTGNMRSLVQNLLLYARSSAGQLKLQPVELDAVLDQVRENVEMCFESDETRIEIGELPTVLGDTASLTVVLQNLVHNGLKFNRSDRREVRVSASSSDDAWTLSIRDNGIGIPPEHVQKVFTPFTRLNGQDEFEGSGLGLATCKRLIERQGGAIQCAPAPDGGTVFSITLPKPQDADQALAG